jgi:lysophospholipase L1-like esterase
MGLGTPGQARGRTRLGRRVGFALVVFVGVFTSAEAGLRLFIWAIEPGETASFGAAALIGENGLRVSATRPQFADAPRILTLGDSSVFGHGLSDGETLHEQLQLQMGAAGVPAAVDCGGVPGYSTEQSIRLLEEVGWKLDPEVLVIANQFSDMNRDRFSDRVLMEQLNTPLVRIASVLSASLVFGGARSLIASARGVPEYAAIGWPSPSSEGVPRVPPDEYVDNLVVMLERARERSVAVVFLQLPERQAMLNGDRPTYAVLMDYVGQAWGVPVVYGDEAYRRAGIPVSTLFQDEVHATAEGQAVLAGALVEALIGAGFPGEMTLPFEKPVASIPEFHGVLPPSHLDSIQEAALKQR